ncbi:MAG: flagellar biosynthesis protein FlgG, partial [Nitrospinae bacterium]|nr:flagellar biosynthesis protein FlgG [Nitrospinota bacterium]
TKEGQIVDPEGNKLLDAFQQPITVDLKTYKQIMVTQEGEILTTSSEGVSESLGFIKVTEFDDLNKLEKVGNSFYRNAGGAKELLPHQANSKIEQGFIELSNVNVVSEMVQMIDATRGYEAMQKVIQSIDSSTGKIISDIGRPV